MHMALHPRIHGRRKIDEANLESRTSFRLGQTGRNSMLKPDFLAADPPTRQNLEGRDGTCATISPDSLRCS